MKVFKKGFLKGIGSLALSVMLVIPVVGKTIVMDAYIYTNEGDKILQESALTFTIPHFAGEIGVPSTTYGESGGAPYGKVLATVVEESSDDILFKITMDANKYPNINTVELYPDTYLYIEEENVHMMGRPHSRGFRPVVLNGDKKEVSFSLSDVFSMDGEDRAEDQLIDFHVFFTDSNGPDKLYQYGPYVLLPGKSTTIFSKNIAIEINGESITSSVSPIMENNSTFVPLRVVSESLGATVDYNGANKEITLTKGDQIIKLKAGSDKATINGISSNLPAAAKLVDTTTFVPLRMIAETFNSDVQWDGDNHKVIITEK